MQLLSRHTSGNPHCGKQAYGRRMKLHMVQDSVCTMALLAGSKSLRLYSLEGLREGSRKPLRKQLLEYAIVHAGVLVTLQGPGLAVITSEGFLAVSPP